MATELISTRADQPPKGTTSYGRLRQVASIMAQVCQNDIQIWHDMAYFTHVQITKPAETAFMSFWQSRSLSYMLLHCFITKKLWLVAVTLIELLQPLQAPTRASLARLHSRIVDMSSIGLTAL